MFFGAGNIGLIFIIFLLVSRIASGSFDLMSTIYMLPGLILALTCHEYAHAKVSDRLGDPTPEQQGRLTLNPLAHLDPMGTICLLFAGFGWGKPVEINPIYYRNPARDNMLVAAAGPIMNFILSFILFVVWAIVYIFAPNTEMVNIIITMLLQAAYLNVCLGVFNLLPFPPLDGSKILTYFLKGKARDFMYFMEKYSFIIIIILFATELPSIIISPVINWIANSMIWLIGTVMGLLGIL